MCAVPNTAVFWSFLTSCFPGMLLTYFLSDFEIVPVAPIITGITFLFTFHMRCISIVSYLYYRIIIITILRDIPQWARAYSFTRFLDHTQRLTTVGRTPLDEGSACRRDLYLTKHNTHNRQTSMLPVRFKLRRRRRRRRKQIL